MYEIISPSVYFCLILLSLLIPLSTSLPLSYHYINKSTHIIMYTHDWVNGGWMMSEWWKKEGKETENGKPLVALYDISGIQWAYSIPGATQRLRIPIMIVREYVLFFTWLLALPPSFSIFLSSSLFLPPPLTPHSLPQFQVAGVSFACLRDPKFT